METLRTSIPQFGSGSLFSCSSSDIPCHHFCLRHSKPLQSEDEEWFMTDEVEEVPEEEEEEDMEEDEETVRTGLLDQLLDDAYAQYYDEPDDWEELATWYGTQINSAETADSERQPSQSTGPEPSSDAREDFHPAWRQDPVGTPRREESTTSSSQGRTTRSSASRDSSSNQGRTTRSSASRDSSSASASSSHSHRTQPQQQSSSSGSQHRHPKERSWDELIADQERVEADTETATRNPHGRNSSSWSDPTIVRELELYDAFSDLFFPDPDSGRL